jgi:hypothetical protein
MFHTHPEDGNCSVLQKWLILNIQCDSNPKASVMHRILAKQDYKVTYPKYASLLVEYS